MAGGAGTRLWPLSRNSCPKQFLDIANTGKTLARQTWERFAGLVPKDNILVVTSAKHKDLIMEQIPELKPENVLLEPYSRNTAPCIAYAAYTLLKRNPDAIMAATPIDHIIFDEDRFRDTLNEAFETAASRRVLITLGVTPTRPDTNFGYIQVTGGDAASKNEALKVKTFTEKPDAELAKIFIDSGEFFWNSGIFVWRADVIREEMEKHLPEVTGLFAGWEKSLGSKFEEKFIEKVYTDCIKISIDYGVMEKTDRAWLLPAKFGWTDIGDWESLYSFIPDKDGGENAELAGRVLKDNDKGNLIISNRKDKLLAVKGLENFMVIDTDDVLLICPKDGKQFKEFVAGIAMPGFEKYR